MANSIRSTAPEGIILILLGLVAFFLPLFTTFSITVLLGIICIVTGCIYLISIFTARSGNFITQVFFGFLGVVVGILLLTHGLTIISILLGIWFVFFSFAMFHRAFTVTTSAWGMVLMVITAIVALLFGIELFAGWPFTGLSIIGEMLGIVLVLQGISFLCRTNN